MAEIQRSQETLKLLIAKASRLGFWDEVVEYEKELAELQNGSIAL